MLLAHGGQALGWCQMGEYLGVRLSKAGWILMPVIGGRIKSVWQVM